MDRREAAALDRHITGNYGEDQYGEDLHVTCRNCGAGLFIADADVWSHLEDAHCDDPVPTVDPFDEYDPPCDDCGQPCSDHVPEQRTDFLGNDYETMACPPITNSKETDMTDQSPPTEDDFESPEGFVLLGALPIPPELSAMLHQKVEAMRLHQAVDALYHSQRKLVSRSQFSSKEHLTDDDIETIIPLIGETLDSMCAFAEAMSSSVDGSLIDLVQHTLTTMLSEVTPEDQPNLYASYTAGLALLDAWADFNTAIDTHVGIMRLSVEGAAEECKNLEDQNNQEVPTDS